MTHEAYYKIKCRQWVPLNLKWYVFKDCNTTVFKRDLEDLGQDTGHPPMNLSLKTQNMI